MEDHQAEPRGAWSRGVAVSPEKRPGSRELLFGTAPISQQGQSALKAPEDASYLCLDQFNSYGKTQLDSIKSYGVKTPELDEINFNAVGTDHRTYTHLGWNYIYSGTAPGSNVDNQRRWEIRRDLLLNTVNAIFDFGLLDEIKLYFNQYKDTRCEGFAQLIYYIHILGDYIHNTDYCLDGDTVIPLAVPSPGIYKRDFLFDISQCLELLFDNDSTKDDLAIVSARLSTIRQKALRIAKSRDSSSRDDLTNCLDSMYVTLKFNIPRMLKSIDFFERALY